MPAPAEVPGQVVQVLGRLRVRLRYAEVVVGAQPAVGGTTVGWGVNARAELGAGFKSQPVTHPVQGALRGVREIVATYTLKEDLL